jgi:hypothetical protein
MVGGGCGAWGGGLGAGWVGDAGELVGLEVVDCGQSLT